MQIMIWNVIEMKSINKEEIQVETLKVKYHDPDLPKLAEIEKGDWIDLRSAERVCLFKGDFRTIKLGVSIELPEGYEALLVPRSSTFKNWGIIQTNGIGIIDESYCGDDDVWMMPVYATREAIIEKGDRICQFRIIKHQPDIDINEVESLGNDSRGGFGTSGKA